MITRNAGRAAVLTTGNVAGSLACQFSRFRGPYTFWLTSVIRFRGVR
jgi:hypothetical protein